MSELLKHKPWCLFEEGGNWSLEDFFETVEVLFKPAFTIQIFETPEKQNLIFMGVDSTGKFESTTIAIEFFFDQMYRPPNGFFTKHTLIPIDNFQEPYFVCIHHIPAHFEIVQTSNNQITKMKIFFVFEQDFKMDYIQNMAKFEKKIISIPIKM